MSLQKLSILLLVVGALIVAFLSVSRSSSKVGSFQNASAAAGHPEADRTQSSDNREPPPAFEQNQSSSASPPVVGGETSQQKAFREFLQKMSQHSEVLHREFNLLEQLSDLHGENGERTNHLVFAAMRSAFQELGEKASTNGQALQLLLDATREPSLQGVAVDGIGVAAKRGSQEATALLLEPEKNGWLLSASAGALVEIARGGSPEAIEFMYRLTLDDKNRPLWSFASRALGPAAASGNEQAVTGLINMIPFENPTVRREVRQGLRAAADNGSQAAAAALQNLPN